MNKRARLNLYCFIYVVYLHSSRWNKASFVFQILRFLDILEVPQKSNKFYKFKNCLFYTFAVLTLCQILTLGENIS